VDTFGNQHFLNQRNILKWNFYSLTGTDLPPTYPYLVPVRIHSRSIVVVTGNPK
jgi:hypothetical protein